MSEKGHDPPLSSFSNANLLSKKNNRVCNFLLHACISIILKDKTRKLEPSVVNVINFQKKKIRVYIRMWPIWASSFTFFIDDNTNGVCDKEKQLFFESCWATKSKLHNAHIKPYELDLISSMNILCKFLIRQTNGLWKWHA